MHMNDLNNQYTEVNLVSLFKAILAHQWYYFTHSWRNKGVHAFHNGNSSKINITVRLDFELTFFDVADRQFNSYAMGELS